MSATLTESAPGKVNLCLFLGGTRGDGRHELVTVFEPVSLTDELTLTVLDSGADEVRCPGVEGPNLVSAALNRLRAAGWNGPPVRVEVAKRIPVAAGMGGGSADAAAALRLASRVAPVDAAVLGELAAALGADVPSQLTGGLSLGTGAGDIVEPIALLPAHAFVIVPLPVALSTADVYREADRLGLGRPAAELEALRDRLRTGELLHGNDLEPAASSLCPAIDGALAALRAAGADHAFVCGSGPTCAGLWWGRESESIAREQATALAVGFPGAVAVIPVLANHQRDRSQFPPGL
jgi:4-diphosphocytidyl-2-C-methyl-D-erythritol kinase